MSSDIDGIKTLQRRDKVFNNLFDSYVEINMQTGEYEVIAQNSNDFIFESKRGCYELYINSILCKVNKNEKEDVKSFFDLEKIRENMKNINGVISQKIVLRYKFEYEKYLETEMYFLRDEPVQYVCMVWKDVTEQKMLLNSALEKVKESKKVKTEFLSRVSHEIITPMNSIIGMTKLVKTEVNNIDKAKEYLNQIENSSNYLLGLINDILDVGQIENDKLELNKEWCLPNEILNNCINMIRPMMEEKGIEFIHSESEEIDRPYESFIDKMRKQQIILNLLNNAYKFTPTGGKVECFVENSLVDNVWCEKKILIRDTGCGISKEFLKHIGELFIQENKVVSEIMPGTGIGLAVVKQIVDAAKGKISIESELGKGTSITIVIPFKWRKIDDHEHYESDNFECKNLSRERLDGINILLVEDHPLNQKIALQLLMNEGANVVVSDDGKMGVEKFCNAKGEDFDVILMDIRMPVMNGLEATRAIRESGLERGKTIPIIAMSADTFTEDVRLYMDIGINYYLSKPVEPEKMYKLIYKAYIESKQK